MRHISKLLVLFFMMTLSTFLGAKKVAIFDEVGRPDSVIAGNGRIYVVEDTTIYIYDEKSYKYIGKFGKKGEGPREIKKNPFGGGILVYPHKDKVYVSSMAKLSIFSKDGAYETEHKINIMDGLYPVGDQYIAFSTKIIEGKKAPVLAVYLCDQKFNRIGTLYVTDIEVGQNAGFNFPFTSVNAIPYKDKIYVVDGLNGFSIKIFDLKGKEIGGFKKPFKRAPLTSEYKKKNENWFKTREPWKNFYGFIKNRFKYKKTFNPIYRMDVNNDLIYVMTSTMKNDLRECIVFDLKGKKIKTLYLPVEQLYGMDFTQKSFYSKTGYYQLRENIDEEVIELHRTQL